MNNIELYEMNLEDLISISNILFDEFDNFWNINILKSEILNNNTIYYIAKINNEIVGYGGILITIDEATINNIVTKKNKRQLGIANIMLQKLIDISKEKKLLTITLEVNENNLPAIKLYEKFSFKRVGLRKNYYNGIENAIIMTLNL